MRGIRTPRENLSEKLWPKISAAQMRLAPTALPHRLAWGIAPGDSIVAELTSAEGAIQSRFKVATRLEQTNQQLNRAFSAGGFSFAIPSWGVAPGSFLIMRLWR
jgi:hypothetical protein